MFQLHINWSWIGLKFLINEIKLKNYKLKAENNKCVKLMKVYGNNKTNYLA